MTEELRLKLEEESMLGDNPTCDICGIYIRRGDRVKQSSTGIVIDTRNDGTELGINEESYSLIHIACEGKTILGDNK